MPQNKFSKKEIEFLRESNAIEGVYDDDSLEQAKYAWEYLRDQKTMTAGVILKTHKILMLHHALHPNHRGYFRDCAVYIGGHKAIPSEDIRDEITTWIKDMNDAVVHDYRDDAMLHIGYEHIHPFVDGNGRTGRMFWNWLMVRRKKPLIIIHEGDEQMEYYRMFR